MEWGSGEQTRWFGVGEKADRFFLDDGSAPSVYPVVATAVHRMLRIDQRLQNNDSATINFFRVFFFFNTRNFVFILYFYVIFFHLMNYSYYWLFFSRYACWGKFVFFLHNDDYSNRDVYLRMLQKWG